MDFDKNFDDIPDEMKKIISIKVLTDRVHHEMLAYASTILKVAEKFGIVSDIPYKLANILMLVGGISTNLDDIDEFEDLCIEFSVKKLRERLSKGDNSILDNINETVMDASLKHDLFQLLEGKISLGELRDKLTNEDIDGKTME